MAGGRSGWDTFKAWMAEGAKDLHNNIVPAFPSYAHGVDEPGTPQNNRSEMTAAAPSFEERIAATAPAASQPVPQVEMEMEP